ncbi:CHASE2 domain-containing protein [Magnetococcales bacterium HHB-1]
MKKKFSLFKRWDFILTIMLFLSAVPAEYYEIFSLLEDQTLSVRHLLRWQYGDKALQRPSDDIVLINTDEDFFEEYQSFPLRRTDLAKIATNLKKLGAKVIALDVLMDFPSSYGEDPGTAKALREAGNTLLVSQADIVHGKFTQLNYPTPILREASRSGYTNISSSSNVVTSLSRLRIYPEIIQQKDGWPFSVTALAMYLGVEPKLENNVLKFGDKLSIPLDQYGSFYIDFPSLGEARFLSELKGITAIEFLDLEDKDEDEIEELRYWVEGKIALVGDTSEVSHDWFDTPVGMVYGVEIIADSIATLMKGAPLRAATLDEEITMALVILILLLAVGMVTSPFPRMILAISLFLGYISLTTAAYIFLNHIFSMSYLMLAIFIGILAFNIRYYMEERGQKKMIKGAFGQYLSPKVVDILVKDPSKLSLGGEQRDMTAFFSDVAGFSSISEKLSPTELVELLNEYLTAMCDIITTYHGTVDKFEGDAIIAFWGAPLEQLDHAKLACYTTIDMNKHMEKMRAELMEQKRPELHVRMGLNSGPMVVGNMGSAQRMDYTIMGDAVNLAARLEGANKFYNSGSMLSEFTYKQAAEFIDVRELDRVRVVGKKEAITIYQLLERKNKTTGKIAEVVDLYHQGLAFYRDCDFKAALSCFEQALTLMPYDGPSQTYYSRCQYYMEEPPPADWDRVFNFTSKG